MSSARNLSGATAPAASTVGAATIRAAVDRERRDLAKVGSFGPDAERQAIEITRVKLRNAADLADIQASPIRCQFCTDPLDDTRPVVAVLTGRPRSPLWLHGGACHAAHSRRHADRIDSFMAAAGYGSGPDATTLDQEDTAS